MNDAEVRAALERHWAVSGQDDPVTVHEIYRDNVVVEYPQSGERIIGRANLQSLRAAYPAKLTFAIRRISGSGDLWVTEYVITYGEKPVNTVSIMEFQDGKVVRETLYFADPFDPPAWRSRWVQLMDASRPIGAD
jgi:SnoaL-like domain